MMLYVPFIYFIFFAIYIYRKYGWNISFYAIVIYILTSFFAILFVQSSEYNMKMFEYVINIKTTSIYCLLITIGIIPLNKFDCKQPIETLFNIKLFNFITIFYILLFFLIVGLFYSDISTILYSNDFKLMRSVGTDGMGLAKLPFLFRALIIIPSNFSFLMLVFYFYSICYLNKSKLYNILILLSSLSVVLLGIMNIDRSKTIYWLFMLGLAYTIFKFHIPENQRKSIRIVLATFISFLIVYIAAVTLSRFGDSYGDTEASLISYGGQSFPYFCWFFEKYKPIEYNAHLFFPLTTYLVDGFNGMASLGDMISLKTGIFINQFYTYLGSFIIDSGVIGMSIFVFIFYLISKYLIKCDFNTFGTIIVVFLIARVPICGSILYVYSDPMIAIGLYLWLYVAMKKLN